MYANIAHLSELLLEACWNFFFPTSLLSLFSGFFEPFYRLFVQNLVGLFFDLVVIFAIYKNPTSKLLVFESVLMIFFTRRIPVGILTEIASALENDRVRRIKPAVFVMDILKQQRQKQLED